VIFHNFLSSHTTGCTVPYPAGPIGLHGPDADIDPEVEYIENPPKDCNTVDSDW